MAAAPSGYDEIKALVHGYIISKTDFLKVKDTLNDDQLRMYVDNAITALCQRNDITLLFEARAQLIREIVGSVVSLGPIRELLEDEEVSEIMINGHRRIYAQKKGKIYLTKFQFDSNTHLMNSIHKLLASVGTSRRVDESSPYVDFSMSDGSRVNVIISPCSLVGPVVTIRKFSRDITTIENFIERLSLTKAMADFLTLAIKAKLNIVFCGATGSGKTTLLNVLSRHISEEERIITIEDTAELRLLQEHVVNLQSKQANIEGRGNISIRELFVNALRMRPDRIIVGEVRGEEILDMIQAISSGHSGTLAIVHAESPEECFSRMISMMMMSGIRLSNDQIRHRVATAVDLIVHSELSMDGVRRVTHITDLCYDKDLDKVSLEDIFIFRQQRVGEDGKVQGAWVVNRRMPSFAHKFEKRNIRLPAEIIG